MRDLNPIAESLKTGDTLTIDAGDDIITLYRRPKRADFEVGDIVYDRESGCSNQMIVVHSSNEPVNEIVQNGVNIAKANRNYDKSDNAVYCIYKNNLLDSIGGIPDDLSMFYKNGKFRVLGVKAYAYPSGRLKTDP